jgi:hypothetical protein
MRKDPLASAGTAFGLLDEKQYKPEIALAEKYQAFTSELLRLALLGIAAFGFLYKEAFALFEQSEHPAVDIATAKCFAASSMYLFGATALFALAFQYFSSETVRMYLEGLRHLVANDQACAKERLTTRGKVVVVCMIAKAGAAIALAAGSLTTALAFIQLLK